MSGHFVVDMTKLTFWPPKRERRAYPNPVFSPPQELGYQGNARRSQSAGQAEVLLVSGKANSGDWRQPVTCRKKRYRWSRLNSLLGNVFTAAGVWSSTTRHMIATRLPFNYPARHTRAGAICMPVRTAHGTAVP